MGTLSLACRVKIALTSQDFPSGYPHHDVIFDHAAPLIAGDQRCFYEPAANWNLTELALFSADWICNEAAKPAPDKYSWLFSSAHFAKLTSGLLDKNLHDASIVLVNTAAILYDWGHECPSQNSSTSDLWRIRSIVGTQVLLGLEIALSDKSLKPPRTNLRL